MFVIANLLVNKMFKSEKKFISDRKVNKIPLKWRQKLKGIVWWLGV